MSKGTVKATLRADLPAKVGDLARFVLIGRQKLIADRAAIKAIDSVKAAAGVREIKIEEAQDLAGALLDAEVRLGELFKEMETKQGFASIASTGGRNETKYGAIKSLDPLRLR